MRQPMSQEDRARLDGRIVVASVSGGKDSAALSLWLTENGVEHRRVFADTGWEHPATLEYVRDVLPKHLGPIDWVTGALQMRDLIRKKGMFPSRVRRFCTEDLKIRPIMAYIEAVDGEVVNAIGIRAAESEARSKLGTWEWAEHFDCWTWRPLIRWTEADVIETHKLHGLPPNPLYLKGPLASAAGRASSPARAKSVSSRRSAQTASMRSTDSRLKSRSRRRSGTRLEARRSSRSATCRHVSSAPETSTGSTRRPEGRSTAGSPCLSAKSCAGQRMEDSANCFLS